MVWKMSESSYNKPRQAFPQTRLLIYDIFKITIYTFSFLMHILRTTGSLYCAYIGIQLPIYTFVLAIEISAVV